MTTHEILFLGVPFEGPEEQGECPRSAVCKCQAGDTSEDVAPSPPLVLVVLTVGFIGEGAKGLERAFYPGADGPACGLGDGVGVLGTGYEGRSVSIIGDD